MPNNPYATESTEPATRTPSRVLAVGLGALFGLLVGSLIVAWLVTPADPFSTLVATVPIYGLSLIGYFLGLRAT